MFGSVKTNEIFDIWLLNLVHMKVVSIKIQAMMTHCNNYPLSSEGNKLPLQLYQTRTSHHQVVESVIDAGALHFLSK